MKTVRRFRGKNKRPLTMVLSSISDLTNPLLQQRGKLTKLRKLKKQGTQEADEPYETQKTLGRSQVCGGTGLQSQCSSGRAGGSL